MPIVSAASLHVIYMAALVFSVSLISSGVCQASSKVSGHLTVRDTLATPGHPARIAARLVQEGILSENGLGGESLDLEIAGKTVGTAMTGGDGRAYFEYIPKVRGNFPLTVSLSPSPRVDASPASGLLGVWEHRRPILFIEALAVMEDEAAPSLSLPIRKPSVVDAAPQPDAAEELSRLAQFYYNIVYLLESAETEQFRAWLDRHHFPIGVIMLTKRGPSELGPLLDDLKKDGWTAAKSGIGRSRMFAETLLERRMEVVIVPEPNKGELPRKAKSAKNWKDVRKQL